MQRQPAAITGLVGLAAGQLPLAPVRTRGQTVTPAYEEWYPNPDGTFRLSWGEPNDRWGRDDRHLH